MAYRQLHGNRNNDPWRTFGKASDIGPPSPSRPFGCSWIEDASGLNDAAFAFQMVNPVWQDVPGTYHNIGCGFAFADGHSETHRWQYRGVKQRGDITDTQDEADWNWLAAHTSARAN